MELVELAFFTDDVNEMAAFYRSLLGIEPVASSEGMAIFMVGGTKIFIHQTYVPATGDLPPNNHMAFKVPDVDAACADLVKAGLAIETPPANYYWGRSAYLRDPDRHMIEITEG